MVNLLKMFQKEGFNIDELIAKGDKVIKKKPS